MTDTSSPELGGSTKTRRRPPRPKYQVFISSTFIDLKDAREHVTWELLKAGHIPVGMENFSAGPDRGWKTIERTIDTSDYYVLVVAGRYGSIDESIGMSWTEREYRYAKEKGVPVLAFIRESSHVTADKMQSGEPAARLEAFVKELRNLHLCEPWTTETDLCSRVVQAVRKQIDEDEADDSQRPGWYRGDHLPSDALALQEVTQLSSENRALRAELEKLRGVQSEVLELWAGDVKAEGVLEVVRPHYAVGERAKTTYVLQQEIGFFVELINKTYWLELLLRNSGSRAAHGVQIELEIDGADDVVLQKDRLSINPSTALENEAQRMKDPNAHIYIDSISRRRGGVTVLQRVKSVGAGSREKLVVMGLRGRLGDDRQVRFRVKFHAASQDGAHAEGTFDVRVGGEEKVMPETVLRGMF